MPLFGKKQPKNHSTGEVALKGNELHVNPPPDVKLARMEARLVRVENSLASGKFPSGSSKEMEFQTIKRRLKMQISLAKGDY